MARLIARPAVAGASPFSAGDTVLSLVDPGAITSLAPYDGARAALSQALKSAHGMTFPVPNRATGKDGARAIWSGRGQAMLIGPAADPALGEHGAVCDQSDGWVVFRLEGADAAAVLARLVPVDLRAGVFKTGHTARSELGHMMAAITRVGAARYDIMVFRSMAQSALHELSGAMRSIAAQG